MGSLNRAIGQGVSSDLQGAECYPDMDRGSGINEQLHTFIRRGAHGAMVEAIRYPVLHHWVKLSWKNRDRGLETKDVPTSVLRGTLKLLRFMEREAVECEGIMNLKMMPDKIEDEISRTITRQRRSGAKEALRQLEDKFKSKGMFISRFDQIAVKMQTAAAVSSAPSAIRATVRRRRHQEQWKLLQDYNTKVAAKDKTLNKFTPRVQLDSCYCVTGKVDVKAREMNDYDFVCQQVSLLWEELGATSLGFQPEKDAKYRANPAPGVRFENVKAKVLGTAAMVANDLEILTRSGIYKGANAVMKELDPSAWRHAYAMTLREWGHSLTTAALKGANIGADAGGAIPGEMIGFLQLVTQKLWARHREMMASISFDAAVDFYDQFIQLSACGMLSVKKVRQAMRF
jgi:hypothetical protein